MAKAQPRFVRIDQGIVREVVSIPAGATIADLFHPDVVNLFISCDDKDVEEGWIYDGQEYSAPKPTEFTDVTVIAAVTLWERMTNDEAEQVNEVMATQPVRVRQIFLTANTFRSDHELWPLLESMATQLFGEVRAAELLAP